MPFSTDVKDPSDFSQYDTAAISETDRAHFLHPWQIFDAIAEEGALPIAAAEGAYIYDLMAIAIWMLWAVSGAPI